MTTDASSERVVRITLLFAIVFGACLLGIVSRPAGLLAAFWPANAIVVGLFARYRNLGRPLDWVAVAAGYGAADLGTGSPISSALLLNGSNLVGIVVGVAVFRGMSPQEFRLRRPNSVIKLAAAACVPAIITSGCGALAANALFGHPLTVSFARWLSAEMTSYVAILPFIATFPHRWRRALRQQNSDRASLRRLVAPTLMFGLCCVLGVVVGGPAAVFFPLPALLWFAISLPLFTNTIVLLLYLVLANLAIASGLVDMRVDMGDARNVVSLRFALTLLILGPLAVSSISSSRLVLMRQLQKALATDSLTGALSRPEFLRRAGSAAAQTRCAVLVLDVDRFKLINDTYGHAAGDAALRGFADAVRKALRAGDHFGRMGGEEFALILPNTRTREAFLFAERLREAISFMSIDMREARAFGITVSIGLSSAEPGGNSLTDALQKADRLLYSAKKGGRNRVMSELVPA